MQHTYLRYECADSFGLVSSAGSTNATKTLGFLPNRNAVSNSSSILLSTANSQLVGFSLRSDQSPCLKLGHRELLSGGVGTRIALNSDEVICLDIADDSHPDDDKNAIVKVATGWMDGTVRVFDLYASELSESNSNNLGCVHSLVQGTSKTNEDFLTREPLVLKGHANSPVRCVCFDRTQSSTTVGQAVSRLASGGSDGVVILWDIVAETGLFRLLGHRGPVTDLSFCSPSASLSKEYLENTHITFDGLVSSSLDGLVKVWDLDAQCCTQTLAGHKGAVLCSTMAPVDGKKIESRWRCVTGCSDGQARVWSLMGPKRLAINQEAQQSEESRQTMSQDIEDQKVCPEHNFHFLCLG